MVEPPHITVRCRIYRASRQSTSVRPHIPEREYRLTHSTQRMLTRNWTPAIPAPRAAPWPSSRRAAPYGGSDRVAPRNRPPRCGSAYSLPPPSPGQPSRLRAPERQMKNNSLSRSAPMGVERFGDTLDEGCVQAIVRKALPLDQHGPLADRGQIRKADIGPLRNRPHVDQHRRPYHSSACAHVSSTDTAWMWTSPTFLSTLDTAIHRGCKRSPQ